MYVRWTFLVFALGFGGLFVWQHPSASRLVSGRAVVVNPHITHESAITVATSENQRRRHRLIVAAAVGAIAILVAAVFDWLGTVRQEDQKFVYQVPTSMTLGNGLTAENMSERADEAAQFRG